MIESVFTFIGNCAILLGVAFCFIGAIGLIRLPDIFARMHGAGIIDTLGIGLILCGLICFEGLSLVSAKLVLILVFVFFSSPTASHALARAALNGGMKPRVENKDFDLPVDNSDSD